MTEIIDLKEVAKNKIRVSIKDLKLGENYKDITTSSIDKLKQSLIEDDQIIPILVDVRDGKLGTILGGAHQFVAINELIDEGKWKHGDKVWIDPVKPRDDKHAKILALKHNAQYDLPTTERLAEWGADLIDSEYTISDIPVITDYGTYTLMDVMDRVAPSDSNPKTKERHHKDVVCPSCGFKF